MPASSKKPWLCKVDCVGPVRVVLNADGEFHIHRGLCDGEKWTVKKGERIGPRLSVDRSFVFDLAPGELCYWVVAERPVLFDVKLLTRVDSIEHLDLTPVELPIGYDKPLPLREEMRRFIRTEMSLQAEALGDETFDESDDFDVPEDQEVISQYELSDMQEEYVGDDEHEEVPSKEKVEEPEIKEPEVEPLEKAAKSE